MHAVSSEVWELNPVHTSNNVEATLSNATMSNVASTKSNVASACPKRQHCRSNRQQSCLLLRQCCFDIVAGVDRALERLRFQRHENALVSGVNALIDVCTVFCGSAAFLRQVAIACVDFAIIGLASYFRKHVWPGTDIWPAWKRRGYQSRPWTGSCLAKEDEADHGRLEPNHVTRPQRLVHVIRGGRSCSTGPDQMEEETVRLMRHSAQEDISISK